MLTRGDGHIVKSPISTPRGLAARLRYLTASSKGYDALARQGISSGRNLYAWLAEERAPNPQNRAAIDRAYRLHRAHNLRIIERLDNHGRGAVVDVEWYRGDRYFTIRDWVRYVEPWALGDIDTMQDEWEQDVDDSDRELATTSRIDHIGISVKAF